MPSKSFRVALRRTMLVRGLLIPVLFASAQAATVSELIAGVRAAKERPDVEVAAMVRKTTLAERLDDFVMEELQSDGAGPRTIEEMEWQRESSRGLPAPKELAPRLLAPPPPADDI